MLLSTENLCHYLLDRNLINRDTVISGDFATVSEPTRNNIFKVLSRTGSNLFIKQVSTFDAHALSILKREAKAYHFISSNAEYAALASVIPTFIDYDKDRHVLVIGYLTGHTSVHEYYFLKQRVIPEFTAKQAEIIASFHFPVPSYADVSAFPKLLPWILLLNDNGPHYFRPNSNNDLVGMIRGNNELMEMLIALKSEWQQTSLIHGDIKWTNFITPKTATDASEVKLVDWEITDIGDPWWDVAGFLQSFLSTWLFGFDNMNAAEHKLQANMKAFDIEQIKPAAALFWRTYIQQMNLSATEEQTALVKTMKYTAARMLQTSIEGIVQTPQVYPNNVRIVQVAFNILKSPEMAAQELFGIFPKAVAI
jgi:aminoglycoside phosphotransferase